MTRIIQTRQRKTTKPLKVVASEAQLGFREPENKGKKSISKKEVACKKTVLTFKRTEEGQPPKSKYTPLRFIESKTQRLLFVKPRPTASHYFKLLRTLDLKNLNSGAEVQGNPYAIKA